MAGLARRLAWHLRLAWRASWPAVALFGALGAAARWLFPVRDLWLGAAVALAAALLAIGVLALAEWRGSRGPAPALQDVHASLERAGTPDLLAHALGRAALMLAAFTLGVGLAALLAPALGRA